MANYLIKSIGNVDLKILQPSKFSECKIIQPQNVEYKILDSAREDGTNLLKQIRKQPKLLNSLEFPIIKKGIDFCKKTFPEKTFTLLFVLTDQGTHKGDTLYLGQIFEAWNNIQENPLELVFITLNGNLSDFNANYNELNPYFNNEKEIKFDYSEDEIVVLTQAGQPDTKFALLLHCSQRFSKELTQIAVPTDSRVAIKQDFPKKIKENLRKNIFPHALKETLAIISAKNLSHTDGSHVMPCFEKDFIEGAFKGEDLDKKKKNFSVYNTYLKNTMDLTADLSGGMGKQSFINYRFSDIAIDLNNLFTSCLGKGLTDGNGEAQLIIDDELNEIIVSLPGGENGKTALVVILKNFFRNLYKHSQPNNNNFYIGDLCLDCEMLEFYKVSLTEKSKTYTSKKIEQTIKKINALISDPILNEDLLKRETGWGIMEMKIAAAYIIGLPLELFENVTDDSDKSIFILPFIEAKKKQINKGSFALQYNFYLLKPKIALVENNHVLSSVTLPEGFDREKEGDHNKVRTRHEFFIGSANRQNNIKLKASNIKQVFLSSKENLKDYLTEKALQNRWLESFQKGIPEANNIHLHALNARSDNPPNNNSLCVFDDHGSWYLRENSKQGLQLDKLYYYEKFNSSEFPDDLIIIINNCKNLQLESEKISRAKETILTNIAILDERIQEDALITSDINLEKYKLQELYNFKRIYIPSRLCNGNNKDIPFSDWDYSSFNGEKCSLRLLMYGKEKNTKATRFEFLKKMLEYYFDKKNCHYVVLHLSGFETIVNESFSYFQVNIKDYSKNDINKAFWYLLNVLESIIKDKSKYLILTSGKGTPGTLPDGSYFVSFSNLEFALKRNKYELVKLLNNIRKVKK